MKKLRILVSFMLVLSLSFVSLTVTTAPQVQAKSSYETFWSRVVPGVSIPGLTKGYIPQGIAYVKDHDKILMSHYRDDKKPATISISNASKKKFEKNVLLYSAKNKPYTGHAGGVAASRKHVWISSEGKLRRLSLNKVLKSKDDAKLIFDATFNTPTKASFTSYSNGVLWVGTFVKKGTSHVVGYKLDSKTDLPVSNTPNYSITIPHYIQGIAVRDNEIILSQSYGRANDSKLLRYKNVLEAKADGNRTINGKKVPNWNLSKSRLKSSITMPPLSQNIAQNGKYLYIQFESGAPKYKKGSKLRLTKVQNFKL
ncbi:hypothetical protein [Aneurinibacillus migulanus]|uniref:Uncharacterized protein n=1 Tax=Aneurinibacillus migulanus TaxID=47500 RepID=A0A0D1Y1I3_ANEMI|nr:hypothetical protein [Aneurinibacillus migulanus]KIV53072.1 hypothetical protein TS65_21465 [Aneurinibacillus migulanus]KON90892.1 hypothetical protein AF333_28240 [Aneurinibacillus migulanus]MED0894080.1 hypothetical protein [Aneurinibacillus migulanus]MED1616811.1 hypothetical protein [Aneurinibacillus migulanus]SDJ92022.1 hypothetical protein SAMN04487909_13255 [Aneurinibacillus migulanus]